MEKSQAAISHPPTQGHPGEVTVQDLVALGHSPAGSRASTCLGTRWSVCTGQGRVGTAQGAVGSWGGQEGGNGFNNNSNNNNNSSESIAHHVSMDITRMSKSHA